ncbi:MAG: hypothetical protein U5K76_15875 [Woeseiaceae bacterium]|nr:hypothetical protein [Woeseiaceae bacterium]
MPADADGDNIYLVNLGVSDGNGGSDELSLAVTVVDGLLAVEVSYPTPNANLGGAATQTTVTGNIVNPSGQPVDPADIAFIDVNGQLATLDAADFSRWSVQVPVAAGDNTLDITFERADGTGTTAAQALHNFGVHSNFNDIEIDTANNRALVIERPQGLLLAVDLDDGTRTVLSGGGIGSGAALNSPRDVVLDAAGNRALLVDWQLDALIAVDLASGERTVVSNNSTGSGPVLDGPQSLALDSAGNRVLVVSTINDALMSVDLVNGDRSFLSGAGVGSGPDFGSLRDVEIDTANSSSPGLRLQPGCHLCRRPGDRRARDRVR